MDPHESSISYDKRSKILDILYEICNIKLSLIRQSANKEFTDDIEAEIMDIINTIKNI